MSREVLASLVVGMALVLAGRGAAEERWSAVPVPAWVEPLGAEPPLPAPVSGAEAEAGELELPAGGRVLLRDTQLRLLRDGPPTLYGHLVVELADRESLANWSTVELGFVPPHEELHLHRIGVRREGRFEDRLVTSRQRLVQREAELDERVLSDERSLLLVLDDLRVGDLLEVEWSVRGSNPVLGGRFSIELSLAPPGVVRRRVRLLAAPTVVIASKVLGGEAESRRRRLGDGTREWVWDVEPPRQVESEARVPADVLQEPVLQLSQFRDWEEVAAWGRRLYPVDAPSARLEAVAADWRTLAAADRVLAALRFVQAEVRYLSLGEGEHTMRPRLPDEVLDSRWGDCKDKAILLATLLGALEVPAWPVLVSSWRGTGVYETLPSPTVFDHAIVAADVDGQRVWLDPTLSPQSARTLGELWLPPYLAGLELRADVFAPTALPPELALRGWMEVAYDYEVPLGLAEWKVLVETRRYRGLADDLRRELAAQGREAVASTYLDYYRRDQPTLVGEPLVVEEDAATGSLLLRESYRRPTGEKGGFDILSLELASMLPDPGKETRRFPLALPYPLEHAEKVTLRYAGGGLEPVRTHLDNRWFTFTVDSILDDDGIQIGYRLSTKDDRVEPAELGLYRAEWSRVQEALGYSVWIDPGERHVGLAIAVLVVAAVSLLAGGWQSRRLLARIQGGG